MTMCGNFLEEKIISTGKGTLSAPNISHERKQYLAITEANELVVSLLLLLEMIQNGSRKDAQLRKIDFFLQRAGGMHLLLLLLNAHYNKRAAGRLPGWTFGILKSRIRLSERSLRLLIRDGLTKGVLMQICGIRDRRARVYCAAPVVVVAWEALFEPFVNTIPQILAKCSPDKIANLDFGSVTRNIAGHEMAAIIPQMWASLPLHASLAGAMISANLSQRRAR